MTTDVDGVWWGVKRKKIYNKVFESLIAFLHVLVPDRQDKLNCLAFSRVEEKLLIMITKYEERIFRVFCYKLFSNCYPFQVNRVVIM